MNDVLRERFAGIDRLYGVGTVDLLSTRRVAVVGMGGVGSWVVEALARTAVGHLTLIDNQINANTGTIRAKAEFDNAGQKLWPGQLVTIKIQTALNKDALVVPPTVVQRGLDQHFVYRVKDGKVEAVPVQMVYQNSELNIIKGVQAGDVLVSDGQSRLKPGASVQVLDEPPELTQATAPQAQP